MITKYRILFRFVLLFTFFLVVGNSYIYQQQRISLIQTYNLSKQSEINILSQLAKESLITENYSLIEWFFNQWGKDHYSVIRLSLENKDGFFLTQFQRRSSEPIDSLTYSKIIVLNDDSYKITLIADLYEINNILRNLLIQLVLVSSIATIILAISIWYLFQKLAIHPLQIEVQRRLKAEKELRHEHQLLKLANKKLGVLASQDPLTGLRNRLNMEHDIEDIIQQHSKHHSPFAVLMFDIDWFKDVNDSYGHDMGDFVLIEVAKLLKQVIREEDRVYRAGGEEFVILLNRISMQDTIYRAEKIRSSIENHKFILRNNKISKTISGGLYHSSLLETDKVKRILKLVDNALYESKAKGRNQISCVNSLV